MLTSVCHYAEFSVCRCKKHVKIKPQTQLTKTKTLMYEIPKHMQSPAVVSILEKENCPLCTACQSKDGVLCLCEGSHEHMNVCPFHIRTEKGTLDLGLE